MAMMMKMVKFLHSDIDDLQDDGKSFGYFPTN